MKLFSSIIDGLQRNMDMRMLRQGMINSNIANAETPGYRPVDLQFEDELRQVLADDSDEMTATSRGHVGAISNFSDVMGETVQQAGELGPDGNAVDLDRQMAQLASNSQNYRASAKIVNKKLALMKYVINQAR